ncbi:Efflux pump roqT [Penicillium diatomitis]|uniref:Efflux pump roqT n=1 Tax=Penicillium diatomitis TaxID=2819901 RepID=A0A9X0BJ16_9EURO|nr:Efflux pump roqT [Penicillium diatomitis]KAJ5466645.1 Efflux pump roqT [Penicillium diatomitis]
MAETPQRQSKHVHEDAVLTDDDTEGKTVISVSETDVDGGDPKQQYPSTWQLVPILIGICLQSICIALDNTILSTATPKITEQFNSLEDLSWYASAYLLTTCAVTLPFGRVYTFFSTKWTYLFALTLFEVGSLVCASTPTSKGLILGRAIAGIGSGGMSPGALLVLSESVPLHRRALYFSIIGSVSGIATITGPILGGLLTDRASWRWCFWLNLPVGAITGLFILVFFKDRIQSQSAPSGYLKRIQKMDPLGLATLLPAVVSLLLTLQWGGTQFSWTHPKIIALLVIFAVSGASWCAIQIWKQDEATVPPRLLKNRNVLGAVIHAMFLGGSFFVFGYYLPIWFQAVQQVSAIQSGINNLPTVITMIVCSTFSGLLVNMIGYYTPLMFLGSAFLTIGFGLCTTFHVHTNYGAWIGYQVIIGIGAGVGFQQCYNALQTVLSSTDLPVGISIITFSQSLSGALFVSIAQNVFQNRLVLNLTRYASSIDPAVVVQAGASNLAGKIPRSLLPSVLAAYNLAVTQTFFVCVAMALVSFLAACLVEWKSMKKAANILDLEKST